MKEKNVELIILPAWFMPETISLDVQHVSAATFQVPGADLRL